MLSCVGELVDLVVGGVGGLVAGEVVFGGG